jgi:quinol monooxygenase YgiN
MFAVIGVWEMDPERRSMQREALEHLVAGVRQAPGFVTGYWLDGSDPRTSHTFIVFDDRRQAEHFADSVRANAANQAEAGVSTVSLDVAEVVATT